MGGLRVVRYEGAKGGVGYRDFEEWRKWAGREGRM